MSNISIIAELLGEENAQLLRNEITKMVLNHIECDLDEMEDYLIDFEDLFDEVRHEVFDNVKDKMIKKYTNEIEAKFEELIKHGD